MKYRSFPTVHIFKGFNLLMIALTMGFTAKAQVVEVIMNVNQVNQLYPTDIWNCQVVVNGAVENQAYFIGEIKDNRSNTLIRLQSAPLMLKQGMNFFNTSNVSTLGTDYYGRNLKQITEQNRTMPAGSYILCLYVKESGSNLNLGGYCQEISLELFTPPVLVMPENKELLSVKTPVFTWLPPMPARQGIDLEYTLKIVEVMEGQNVNAAMNENRAIHVQPALKQQFYNYPVDAYKLKEKTPYAWQISAYIGGEPVGATDVWQFTIGEEEMTETVTTRDYGILKTKLDGKYYNLANNTISFIYVAESDNESVDYKIYNEVAGSFETGIPVISSMKKGKNKVNLVIGPDAGHDIDLDPGYYRIEVYRNDRTEYYRFTF